MYGKKDGQFQNISRDIEIIKSLYDNSSSAVLINNITASFFNNTFGVIHGCLLSPVLFNTCIEYIVINTLHEHNPTSSIGGRNISNLRFAEYIDLILNTKLQEITNRLVESLKAHGIENKSREDKKMLDSTNYDKNATFTNTFKYLGTILK